MYNDGFGKGEIHLGLGQFARVLPGQVRVYARKSHGRGDGANRSIDDQVAACVAIGREIGLPIDEATDVRAEPVGFSGASYWEGGGSTNIEGDDHRETRPRPVLTKLCREIASGQVKVLLVWSLDRLARSVALMGAFMELLTRHKVFLLDRNGLVPIHTPEGRQSVNTNMAMAQHYREMCRANTERALMRKRQLGQNSYNPNGLGFRSDGKGGVVAIPEEIALVNRIFRMYDEGEEGSGPLSQKEIAKRLDAEGFRWPSDLSWVSDERSCGTPPKVSSTAIRRILSSLRFQAKQRHQGQIYDAKDFLIDGEPAVNQALFQRVSARLSRNRSIPRRCVGSHALSGIVRCGICARRFVSLPNRWTTRDGVKRRNNTWRYGGMGAFFDCTHKTLGIRVEVLDEYVIDELAPLLIAELKAQQRVQLGSSISSRIAELRLRIDELQTKQAVELPRLMRGEWMSNPSLVAQMHGLIEEDILKAENEIVHLRVREERVEASLQSLEKLKDLPSSHVRETLRAVLRWVAIVPNDTSSVRSKSRRYDGEKCQGRLLFLTSWGSYHTAVVERSGKLPTGEYPYNRLRLALPEELLGGVSELPNPELFVNNLRREQLVAGQQFDPAFWCPGYGREATLEEFLAEYKLEDAA